MLLLQGELVLSSDRLFQNPLFSAGVILDSNLGDNNTTQETDQTRTHDNTKFKKPVILRGKNGSHCIPMELTRHRSDLQHAYFADNWSDNTNYSKDDYTKYNGKFYKCLLYHTSSLAANSPESSEPNSFA